MTLIVDANVAFEIVLLPDGFDRLRDEDAVAPPLLWPEVRSALHVAMRRGLLERSDAEAALTALTSGPLRERRHRRLGETAWRIADEIGWSKTYAAEYLALASLLDAPVATFDRRVLRAAQRLSIRTHEFA
ncbi:MAG TPA: type II toxin-antitoxin system VapC family toxin [Actinomycetota bacterium]|nr:type II toxin-antitoxin system VapC family toxin [Actinomycetota bacterium]